MKNMKCPICDGNCHPLDVVDFNKSCEEARGKFLPLSGTPIYYFLCEKCNFCCAPSIYKWGLEDFSEKIYNELYIEVDPDYKTKRPETNAANLIAMFKDRQSELRHLDYGGGNGLLSKLVISSGWKSESYDPFYNNGLNVSSLGKFNLITAFEVFEHVPDVNELMLQITLLLESDGIVLFSTLLSDGNVEKNKRLNWWYASPRNGHISLFSKTSLNLLASKYKMECKSFSNGLHMFFRSQTPNWAEHIIRRG